MTVIPTEEDPLLTTREVANVLGVKPETVVDWIHAHKIEAIRIGKTYRIQKSVMVKFVNDRYGE